jgi:tetratricopeptide (TPR) repeat protein
MNKKKLTYITALTMLSLTLITGCTNERRENQTAYRQIGINAMESGDYAGAVDAFNSALGQCIGKITENELDICYYKAAAQYASGDSEGAVATYTAIIDYDKKAADAYYLRGCVYLKQGNTESAVSDFDAAVQYNSDDYELYVNIYENLLAYDMTEKGEEYLNKAFDIKGNSAEDYAWRGRIYYYLGQYDNAMTELNSALDKESVIANLYIAQVYEAQSDSENAEVYYQNYVNSGAADSEAMNSLGEIEMAKGNYSGALTYLQQGIAMENVTNRRELMQNLIICYEYTFDFNSAWNIVQEYVQAYPDDASAQREYIFLKNRVDASTAEISGDVSSTEEGTTEQDTTGTEESTADQNTTGAEGEAADSDQTGTDGGETAQ